MGIQVVNTAQLTCSFGIAPSTLTVLPDNRVQCNNQPAANILDSIPMTNIMSFGMCSSPANPSVAAATAAAQGVLTPMPCVPATSAPWTPGVPSVLIADMAAVDDESTCMCDYGGEISVDSAGQEQVTES
ncbi:MAG TPA: DUF4280 domain-containing protein [Steroidobacteraceae bacterium]|nr:DUF4280 domain-containing protein [Steroidobacteraceae bacterium]